MGEAPVNKAKRPLAWISTSVNVVTCNSPSGVLKNQLLKIKGLRPGAGRATYLTKSKVRMRKIAYHATGLMQCS